jgi:hypothetical protein
LSNAKMDANDDLPFWIPTEWINKLELKKEQVPKKYPTRWKQTSNN